ncbi:hypothetical protein R6Q59_027489 [Mikania micrantha]
MVACSTPYNAKGLMKAAIRSDNPAAQTMVNKGYDTEVIDIRSLKPFDLYTIGNSIKKTHCVLIVELGHVYPLISLRMVDDISDWTLKIN